MQEPEAGPTNRRATQRGARPRPRVRAGWAQLILGMVVAAAGTVVMLQAERFGGAALWVGGSVAGVFSLTLVLSAVRIVEREDENCPAVPAAARRTGPSD